MILQDCLKKVKSTFTPKEIVNFIVCLIKLRPYDLGAESTIENCLFGAATWTKKADIDT